MECEYKDQLSRCIKTEGTNSKPFCENYPDCLYKKGRESIKNQPCPDCEKTTDQIKISEVWLCGECGGEYETIIRGV